MKKEDLRKRKTKNNLYKSFLKLIKIKSFTSIKITDICEDAKVNRSTFYDHFKDKYELLDSFIKESTVDLKIKLLDIEKTSQLKKDLLNNLEIVLKYFEENKEVYSILISINKTSLIFASLIDTFKEAVVKKYDDTSTKTLVLFYSSASIGIIIEKLENIDSFQKEIIYKEIKRLIPNLDIK